MRTGGLRARRRAARVRPIPPSHSPIRPTHQTIVVMFSSITYLTLALAEMPDAPFGIMTLPGGWHTLHYADWVFATPLLLVRGGGVSWWWSWSWRGGCAERASPLVG